MDTLSLILVMQNADFAIIGSFCKKYVQNRENLGSLKAETGLFMLGNAVCQVGPPAGRPEGKCDPSFYTLFSVLVSNKSPQFNLRHNLKMHTRDALVI